MRQSVTARALNVNVFILEKGSRPVTCAGVDRNDHGLAADFAARLDLAFEKDIHGVGRIARGHQSDRPP